MSDGLREALDAHVWEAGFNIHSCHCGWRTKGLVSVASALWADHREQAVRAAFTAHLNVVVAQCESSPVDPPHLEADDAGSTPVGLGAAASSSGRDA